MRLRNFWILIVAAGLALPVGGCSVSSNRVLGGAGGAIAGGLLGSSFGLPGKIVGAVVGGLAGQSIGGLFDNAPEARRYHDEALLESLNDKRINKERRFDSVKENVHGTVMVTNEWFTQSREYCRQYQTKITIGGRQEQAFGNACRQRDGSWQLAEK